VRERRAVSYWARSEGMDKVVGVRTVPGAAGRSMQARAAFGSGVSQQAFKHAAGSRVAGVVPARVTPISKIPMDSAGFAD
jgi:hypothetical protein